MAEVVTMPSVPAGAVMVRATPVVAESLTETSPLAGTETATDW